DINECPTIGLKERVHDLRLSKTERAIRDIGEIHAAGELIARIASEVIAQLPCTRTSVAGRPTRIPHPHIAAHVAADEDLLLRVRPVTDDIPLDAEMTDMPVTRSATLGEAARAAVLVLFRDANRNTKTVPE